MPITAAMFDFIWFSRQGPRLGHNGARHIPSQLCFIDINVFFFIWTLPQVVNVCPSFTKTPWHDNPESRVRQLNLSPWVSDNDWLVWEAWGLWQIWFSLLSFNSIVGLHAACILSELTLVAFHTCFSKTISGYCWLLS